VNKFKKSFIVIAATTILAVSGCAGNGGAVEIGQSHDNVKVGVNGEAKANFTVTGVTESELSEVANLRIEGLDDGNVFFVNYTIQPVEGTFQERNNAALAPNHWVARLDPSSNNKRIQALDFGYFADGWDEDGCTMLTPEMHDQLAAGETVEACVIFVTEADQSIDRIEYRINSISKKSGNAKGWVYESTN